VVPGESVGSDGNPGQDEVDVVRAGAPHRRADADDHHVHRERGAKMVAISFS
jgi:hypothetical protein